MGIFSIFKRRLRGDDPWLHGRWLLARSDSPWYPTMKLFRQSRLGAWDEVFAAMAKDLKAVAIIQHDPRDVAKLPAFPQGAE